MRRGKTHKRILIGFRLVDAMRDVLEGVGTYVRSHRPPWQIQCVDADQFPELLRPETADGAITVVGARAVGQLRRVIRAGVPTVNMLHDLSSDLPCVLSDDEEVGAVAARDFVHRGFRRFAFVGFSAKWSEARERGFGRVLRAAGHDYVRCEPIARIPRFADLVTKRADRTLSRWVAGLTKPVAIFAASDAIGSRVLAACVGAGVAVPDDVALLGVDNIVHVCELAPVPMSSVAQDFERMGFEAAAILDRLINRKPIARPLVLIPPGRVVARRSTDVLAFEDDHVTAAMRLIHDRAATGIGIKEILAQVPVSRRWLDVRFKALVGHSVSEEIRKRRVEQLKELLLQTDLSVKRVALRCGFSRSENMVRFFRDACGMPPHAYRVRHRADRQSRTG